MSWTEQVLCFETWSITDSLLLCGFFVTLLVCRLYSSDSKSGLYIPLGRSDYLGGR
jgi:hypothetical protein